MLQGLDSINKSISPQINCFVIFISMFVNSVIIIILVVIVTSLFHIENIGIYINT